MTSGRLVPVGRTIRTAFSCRSIAAEPGGYTEYFLQNLDGSYSLIR
jgi:hypothetical protein